MVPEAGDDGPAPEREWQLLCPIGTRRGRAVTAAGQWDLAVLGGRVLVGVVGADSTVSCAAPARAARRDVGWRRPAMLSHLDPGSCLGGEDVLGVLFLFFFFLSLFVFFFLCVM